jgi:Tol biopolymer transport system component
MGPFKDFEIIVPKFAHNVKPFQAPDGTWLVYYVGSPNHDPVFNCTDSTAARVGSPVPPVPQGKEAAGPIMIASSASPDAPQDQWTTHGPFTDSVAWHSATNPSPVFYPNGSVLLAVSRRFSVGSNPTKNTWLMAADSWRGPYRNITQSFADALETGEDPDMFQTKRGYHMLNHNTGPGSSMLSFSDDGVHNWQRATGSNAFNETVLWSNGSVTHLCTRQRPQIVLAADGMPGWLWSGGGYGGPDPAADCNSHQTFTFAQQIYRS